MPARRRNAHGSEQVAVRGRLTKFKTLRDIEVGGKRVVVREDLNVPMKDGAVADDTRIVAALETLRYLRDRGARSIVLSHLGRPDGKVVPALSLRPVAAELHARLGSTVAFAPDCVGPAAQNAVAALSDGDVLLLENVRFHPEEEDERSGLRPATRLARRTVRQRRLRDRAPRACLDRGHRARPAVRRRLPHGSGTRRARAPDDRSDATLRLRDRWRESQRQGRRLYEPGRARRRVRDRRRHGEHVPRRAGRRGRNVAARRRSRTRQAHRGAVRREERAAAPADRCGRRRRRSTPTIAPRPCRSRTSAVE